MAVHKKRTKVILIRILAIDQATKNCGFCVIDKTDGVVSIERLGSVELEGDAYEARIAAFKKWLELTIKKENIDYVSMEDIQFQRNQKTYKILAEMLGVMKNCCIELGVECSVVPPVTWKSYCGIKGRKRAEQKENTIYTVKKELGIDVGEDTADAICIGFFASEWAITDEEE